MTLPTTPLTDAEIENLANQPRAYALTNAKVLATITSLRGELQRTREALAFYADPWEIIRKQPYNDRRQIPDFYNDCDFGDVARALLTPPTGESK